MLASRFAVISHNLARMPGLEEHNTLVFAALGQLRVRQFSRQEASSLVGSTCLAAVERAGIERFAVACGIVCFPASPR